MLETLENNYFVTGNQLLIRYW